MNANTLNNFYHTLKQSSDNHKPHRHRKTHGADDEFIFRMKLKMAKAKAKNMHKRVIARARLARNNYNLLNTMNMGDANLIDLFDEQDMEMEANREEALRQDMEDRDH